MRFTISILQDEDGNKKDFTMVKTAVKCVLAATLALLLSGSDGCEQSDIAFFHPLYNSSDELFLPQLVGTWESEDQILVFGRWPHENAYRFTHIKAGDTVTFKARLVKLDEYTLIDHISTDYIPIAMSGSRWFSEGPDLFPVDDFEAIICNLVDAFVMFLGDHYLASTGLDTAALLKRFVAQVDRNLLVQGIRDSAFAAEILENDELDDDLDALFEPSELIQLLTGEIITTFKDNEHRHSNKTKTFFTHGLMLMDYHPGSDSLTHYALDLDWAVEQLKTDSLGWSFQLRNEGGVNRYLVTASTAELRQFIPEHAHDLFNKGRIFQRQVSQ